MGNGYLLVLIYPFFQLKVLDNLGLITFLQWMTQNVVIESLLVMAHQIDLVRCLLAVCFFYDFFQVHHLLRTHRGRP